MSAHRNPAARPRPLFAPFPLIPSKKSINIHDHNDNGSKTPDRTPPPLLPHFGFSLTETYSHAATVVLVINRR